MLKDILKSGLVNVAPLMEKEGIVMTDKQKHLEILTKMFTDNINFPFDGEEEVSDVKTMATKVLSHAEDLYSEEYHYREYPDFKDFLYTGHVDTIAYDVYIGDIE